MNKKWFAMIALCVAIVGTSCSSNGGEDAPSKLTGTQEYSSVDEIGNDLRARAIDCTPQQDAKSTAFTTAGRCTVDGQEIVLGIFTNDSQLSEFKSNINFVATTLGEESYLVVGSNWVANCSSDQSCADRIQSQLGGQVWVSKS